MSTIPLHIQRRFEQRWVAQFRPLAIPAVPKNVGLKASPVNKRPVPKGQKKNPPG
jgi:hypothetical protein